VQLIHGGRDEQLRRLSGVQRNAPPTNEKLVHVEDMHRCRALPGERRRKIEGHFAAWRVVNPKKQVLKHFEVSMSLSGSPYSPPYSPPYFRHVNASHTA
jgi:hypothetical protein